MIVEPLSFTVYIVGLVVAIIVYGFLRQTDDIDGVWLVGVIGWPITLLVLLAYAVGYIPYYLGKKLGEFWEKKLKKFKKDVYRK